MSMNTAPNAERVHIGIFGKRNAGKSSLINAMTGQDLAIVSNIAGTTTDPVSKAMELLPLGPVVMIDTPGLDDIGALGAQRVRKAMQVMNKCDLVPSLLDIPMIGNAVRISAKTGEGIGDLLAAVEENLPVSLRRVCLLLPFDQAGLVAQIRKDHVLYQEEYRPDGIFVSALLDPVLYGRVREYEILENT